MKFDGIADKPLMKLVNYECQNIRSLSRRQFMVMGGIGLTGLVISSVPLAANTVKDDLDLVLQLPQMTERDGPLLVFRDFETDPDIEVERHIRSRLIGRKKLFAQLKRKLGFKKQISLSIEHMQVCLKFVAQREKGPAGAYRRYCLDVLDFLFNMIKTDNFYSIICSPMQSYPQLSPSGISAFLVHRLAKDFQATCRFTADTGNSVVYKTSGAIFSDHLGAVELELQVLNQEQFGLKRRPYTIWQNNSDDLFNLMAIPVEETLHFHLSAATDRQIADVIQHTALGTSTETRQLAEEWMAVEESVVGGLVHHVLNQYCARYRVPLSQSIRSEKHLAKQPHGRYKYRQQGIQLAQKLGFQNTLKLYMDSPANFRGQLKQFSITWPKTPHSRS